jgi:hypothetical protein
MTPHDADRQGAGKARGTELTERNTTPRDRVAIGGHCCARTIPLVRQR